MSKAISNKKNILIILPTDADIGGVEIPLYEFIHQTKHDIFCFYLKAFKFGYWRRNEFQQIGLRQLFSVNFDYLFTFFWQPALLIILTKISYTKIIYFENTTIGYTSYRKFLQKYLRLKSDYIIFDSKDTYRENRKYLGQVDTAIIPFVPKDLAEKLTAAPIDSNDRNIKACVVTRWSDEKGIKNLKKINPESLGNIILATPTCLPNNIAKKFGGVIDGRRREKIWELYSQSHYSLSLSPNEGLGISILESISKGCIPLILSDHFIGRIIEKYIPELRVNSVDDIENILTDSVLSGLKKEKILNVLWREILKNGYDVAFADSMERWLDKA